MTGNFISGPQKQWKLKLSIVDFHKQGHRDLNIRSVNVLISGKVCFKAFYLFIFYLFFFSILNFKLRQKVLGTFNFS